MAFVKLPKGMASVMIEEMLIIAKEGVIWVRDGIEDHVCAVVPGATKVSDPTTAPRRDSPQEAVPLVAGASTSATTVS